MQVPFEKAANMSRGRSVYPVRQERRREKCAGTKHFVTLLAGLVMSGIATQSQNIQGLSGVPDGRENQRRAELGLARLWFMLLTIAPQPFAYVFPKDSLPDYLRFSASTVEGWRHEVVIAGK
jgi:hypothetical protein